MKIHIGTSGYNYPEWRGTFYPEGFSTTKMFAYYAERFHTVEINATFYRMPTVAMAEAWRGESAGGFHVHAQGAAADHARRPTSELRRLGALFL